MNFVCEPETRVNEAGQIETFKVTWTEARELTECFVETTGDNLAYAGPSVFGLSFIPAIAFQMGDFVFWGAVIMVLCMGGAYCLWRRLPRMSGVERVLIFRRDGKMRAPLGLSAGRFPNGESRLPHNGITSVEARPMVLTGEAAKTRYNYGVVAFYRSGQLNQLAENLMPDQAHLLAVVTMAGLKELHDDLIVGPGQRARPRAAMSEDELID